MKTLFIENKKKIMQNKDALENKLGVKIGFKGNNLVFEGCELDEYTAERVFEAIELGFSVNDAMLLADENYAFEKLNVKDISKRRNISQVRARVIGTFGKTLKTISALSDCKIVLHNNTIGIIGRADCIEMAIHAMKSLVKGSKQANVYSYLEKSKKLAKCFGEFEVIEEDKE